MPAKAKKLAASKCEINEAAMIHINKRCKIKKFFVRKIHHLWDNYYRVNYHCTLDDEHKILDSYWVEVPKDEKPAK